MKKEPISVKISPVSDVRNRGGILGRLWLRWAVHTPDMTSETDRSKRRVCQLKGLTATLHFSCAISVLCEDAHNCCATAQQSNKYGNAVCLLWLLRSRLFRCDDPLAE
jgi:hypothetical protein